MNNLISPNTVSQNDEKPYTAELDDTAITYVKIEITEIPHEKSPIPQYRKVPCPPPPPPPLIRQSHCHQRSRHRIQSAGLLQSNSSSYNFSQKIENNMKENHGLRQLPKSRFPRNRKVISQFTAGIKQAIHGSRRYPLTPSILVYWKRKGPRTTSDV